MTNARWFIAVVLLALTLTGANFATAADDPPSDEQIAFAKGVYGLMLNELVAALFQEFNETTVDNVEQGKLAISLIFNDSNRDMRLVGTFAPLLGRSLALSNTFHQNCVLCHTNFTDKFFKKTKNPGQWVGALIQRVPINTDD